MSSRRKLQFYLPYGHLLLSEAYGQRWQIRLVGGWSLDTRIFSRGNRISIPRGQPPRMMRKKCSLCIQLGTVKCFHSLHLGAFLQQGQLNTKTMGAKITKLRFLASRVPPWPSFHSSPHSDTKSGSCWLLVFNSTAHVFQQFILLLLCGFNLH